MEPPPQPRPRPARGGGALIALCTLAGGGIGVATHEASLGVVVGAVLGLLLAALLWFADRRQGR